MNPVGGFLVIVGEKGKKPQAIRLLAWICRAKLPELRDRLFSAAAAGRFCFIKRLHPFAWGRRLTAKNLTIDLHGFVGLVLHRESPCLVEAILLFEREHAELLDCLY